ncbi:MAG: MFS transporter [Clostridiales bacterium]|nr:MFS transporter [Clostridiales bacterium]
MSENETAKEKVPVMTRVKNFGTEIKTHWNEPAEGKYVPYKEYLSIFAAIAGNYSLTYILGFLSFGTGCYLVAYYYEIPILTFTAINAFFIVSGYFWSILSMGVDANLGFLPKKTERKYFAVYLTFAAIGLIMLFCDLSSLPFWPESIVNYMDTSWPGINFYSIFKIVGIHSFVSGWGGFRAIVIRKKLVPKLGRYKIFAYSNVIQCIILVILICELPLYEEPLVDRVWKLYVLFQLYGMLGFTGSPQSIADNISPNGHERMIIRCYPVKLAHLLRSLMTMIIPTVAGMLFVNGVRDVGTFKYIIPAAMLLSTVIMFSGLGKIKERIPAPPIEKKKYFSFWDCVSGIMKNKYLWIRQISVLLDSLGNGMLAIKTVLLIYTWRETGFFFALAENVISFVGNPGAFLAPWIRKRFQYKTLYVFKQLVMFASSGMYVLVLLFLGTSHTLCGIFLFIGICACDSLKSAIELASSDMDIRISDYQMYISGERFESYQGIVSWFTSPISTLISLIIPLLFYRCGFTSDWDVLFIDEVRIKCVLIGLAFDMAGYILMCLPYIFFWDFTDEKHAEIMKILQERADAAAAEDSPVNPDDPDNPTSGEPVPVESEAMNE